jgi:hypothetical protein
MDPETLMNGSNLAAALLLYGTLLGATPAQATMAPEGAYERLSPHNQKVAVALYEAQVAVAPGTPRRLSLQEIAARRQSGQAWDEILTELKARGLVKADSVGQVVARYTTEQRRRDSAHAVMPGGNVVK